MTIRRFVATLLPAALLGAAPAMAQQADPAAAPASAQTLTNSNLTLSEGYADWTVRCFQVKSIAPCDMVLVASNKDSGQRVLLVSIAYIPSKDGYVMQMIVPLGVALAKGMTLDAGAKPLAGVAFNRCERDGCYVEMPVPNETIQALTAAGNATNISLTPYGKADTIKLPLSLNGFSNAVNKMKGYARDKATNPPPEQQ